MNHVSDQYVHQSPLRKRYLTNHLTSPRLELSVLCLRIDREDDYQFLGHGVLFKKWEFYFVFFFLLRLISPGIPRKKKSKVVRKLQFDAKFRWIIVAVFSSVHCYVGRFYCSLIVVGLRTLLKSLREIFVIKDPEQFLFGGKRKWGNKVSFSNMCSHISYELDYINWWLIMVMFKNCGGRPRCFYA